MDTDSFGFGTLIVFAIIVVLLILIWRRFFSGYQKGLYQAAKLMSAAECEFYRKLMVHCPQGMVIMSKVRLADLVTIPGHLRGKERFKVFAPLAQKHVDYVVFDPARNQVVRVIELNDSTHHQMERRQRDIYIRNVLESAGISLVFIPLKRSYATSELTDLFR